MASPAEKIVNTINDAVVIAGLEMTRQPELMAYATGRSALSVKRLKIRQFRTRATRRVLKSDIKITLARMAATKRQPSKGDLQYIETLSKLASEPDSTFLAAVEKIRNVFNKVGFADHVKMMGHAMQEARQMDSEDLNRSLFSVYKKTA